MYWGRLVDSRDSKSGFYLRSPLMTSRVGVCCVTTAIRQLDTWPDHKKAVHTFSNCINNISCLDKLPALGVLARLLKLFHEPREELPELILISMLSVDGVQLTSKPSPGIVRLQADTRGRENQAT
jgi:hypothetical protein